MRLSVLISRVLLSVTLIILPYQNSWSSVKNYEIFLSEGQKYITLFDGVYMDEQTYKDYVFKHEAYDKLNMDHTILLVDFENYKQDKTRHCSIFENYGVLFFVGILITGVTIGVAVSR